jgi:hypothetical protein
MKKFVRWVIFLTCLAACTDIYRAETDSPQQVPVIDAFLSNTPGNHFVRLSYSLPFDTVALTKKITGARIYVTDNTGKTIPFGEVSAGLYKPSDVSFAGEINHSYILTVEMPDKQVYVSAPEPLLPQVQPVKVSGGYEIITKLVKGSYGTIFSQDEPVCQLYYDYKTASEQIPRFRYTSAQILEYEIFKEVMPPVNDISGYMFYCWIVTKNNTLLFTNEKYRTNAGEIINQLVSTTTPGIRIIVPDMSLKTLNYDATRTTDAYEYRMILRINQFRLNDDSYEWYKGVESQATAEGKIFDPLTSQLFGNITCKSTPDKPVLGFFEVSSVSTNSWSVSRNYPLYPITVKSVPNVYPSDMGFTINTAPAFWIN